MFFLSAFKMFDMEIKYATFSLCRGLKGNSKITFKRSEALSSLRDAILVTGIFLIVAIGDFNAKPSNY